MEFGDPVNMMLLVHLEPDFYIHRQNPVMKEFWDKT